MKRNLIDIYINECLSAHLVTYGLTTDTIDIVAQDIRNRLSSIISRWNDTDFLMKRMLVHL